VRREQAEMLELLIRRIIFLVVVLVVTVSVTDGFCPVGNLPSFERGIQTPVLQFRKGTNLRKHRPVGGVGSLRMVEWPSSDTLG